MNDRFKFRIWWKKENRYRVDTHIITIGHLTDFANDNEYVVEQCTGLKDKNGYLIYEGDIIHEVDKEADIDDVSQIVWNQDTCHFMKLDLPETGLDRHCLLCEADSPYIEITGNIHKQAEQKDAK
jgi:uncharacterized phage protein (TIGR01671 family)